MFNIMQVLFPILFLAVMGIIIVTIVRGIMQWAHNNAQPRIPAEALVVAKRASTNLHHHHTGTPDAPHMHTTTSTSYYVTFEFISGDRLEYHVSSSEYGMIAEGDIGTLTSQGTRYISFERQR